MLMGVPGSSPITDPRLRPKRTRSKGPFLRQHYPASTVGCVVITGSEKAFAAGADIKEMAGLGYPQTYLDNFIASWDRVASRRKPIVAAVAGFALGARLEPAMMCDIILAADTAKFGQPEIKLGVMPGAGGTQRLT